MERFAVKGIFVDTPTPDTLRVRDGYMLCEDGRCGAFREAAPAGMPVYDHSGQIITPGFVDLHLHAPQTHRVKQKQSHKCRDQYCDQHCLFHNKNPQWFLLFINDCLFSGNLIRIILP